EDAGVVHEDVEAAPGIERLLDHPLARLERGNAVVVRDGLATHLLDFFDNLFGGAGVGTFAARGTTNVVDDDAGTFLGEQQGFAAANAAPGAGDNGDFAFKPSGHSNSLLLWISGSHRGKRGNSTKRWATAETRAGRGLRRRVKACRPRWPSFRTP